MLILILALRLLAHHGTAVKYDQANKVTLKGAVTEFVYKNPHVEIGLDVKDPGGKVAHWSVEAVGVYYWSKSGWTKDSLKAGDAVTLVVAPSKAGTPAGELYKITLADGKSLTFDESLK